VAASLVAEPADRFDGADAHLRIPLWGLPGALCGLLPATRAPQTALPALRGRLDAVRLMSRFSMVRSDEARLDPLADDPDLARMDESDPRSVARCMTRVGRKMDEDLGPEFDEGMEMAEQGRGKEESKSPGERRALVPMGKPRGVKMAAAVAAGLAIGLAAGAGGIGAAAPRPNAVVAADHWAYPALFRLAAEGLAPLWAASVRPLPRLEVARMVSEASARAAQREAAGIPLAASMRADLAALRDEFAAELRLLHEERAGQRPSAGTGSGVAIGAAGTARAAGGVAPRFARVERGGLDLDRLYLGARAGDVAIQAGRDTVWWGPGYRGAFLLSDNTGPLDYLGLSLTTERFRLTKLIAPLADPERYLYGLRVDWQARDDLRIGFGEVMVGPGGLSALYALNVVPGLAYGIAYFARAPAAYNDNYSFALDADWRPRRGVVVYGELYVDDLVVFDPYNPFPHRLGGTVGLYLADPFGDGRTSLRFEHSRATNWIYATPNPAGTPLRAGRALGHWCAPDCELWSVTVARTLSSVAVVLVGYDLIRKGEGRLGQTWTDPNDAWRRYYLAGIVETTHALRATATWARGAVRGAATVAWTSTANAGHIAGATRQDWHVLVETTYGF
jgi:hypothetical protein